MAAAELNCTSSNPDARVLVLLSRLAIGDAPLGTRGPLDRDTVGMVSYSGSPGSTNLPPPPGPPGMYFLFFGGGSDAADAPRPACLAARLAALVLPGGRPRGLPVGVRRLGVDVEGISGRIQKKTSLFVL